MVCRTFAIHTLPCYLILNKIARQSVWSNTGKSMFQMGVNQGWHCFGCTSYLLLWYPNEAVLCKVALQELTLFCKQLRLGTSPQIWFYIQEFQGSKLLNSCLDLVVWPNVFQWIFKLCHWLLYTISQRSKQFLWNLLNLIELTCSTNFVPSDSC